MVGVSLKGTLTVWWGHMGTKKGKIMQLTVAVPEIWDILEMGKKKCAHIFQVPITFLELY